MVYQRTYRRLPSDKSQWAAYWAADAHIAPWLAEHITKVSPAYAFAGGGSKVVLAAPSIGTGIGLNRTVPSSSRFPWVSSSLQADSLADLGAALLVRRD